MKRRINLPHKWWSSDDGRKTRDDGGRRVNHAKRMADKSAIQTADKYDPGEIVPDKIVVTSNGINITSHVVNKTPGIKPRA